MERLDFSIEKLGQSSVLSPIHFSHESGDCKANYVLDTRRLIYDLNVDTASPYPMYEPNELLEIAGPREKIYFHPKDVNAAIVTCGGLCPGLNDVVRAIVMALWYRYGVKCISGIRYGYRGFLDQFKFKPLILTPDYVRDIHHQGGTLLGSSRGYGDRTSDIVDSLERREINMLFVIGGDGTQKGALSICNELKQRGSNTVVIGVPKTIDNDLSFVQRSFGFETSVSMAVQSVSGAHVEASGAINGIGLVKVMGRESGFIAAQTALAINDVNYVLIPEVPFELEGENGLFRHVENRLMCRNHAVILVAEGAGDPLMADLETEDASGNRHQADIGIFLKTQMATHFQRRDIDVSIKYIDPSYIIRSAPANANDSVYCTRLGTNAVHAAMTGRTGMLISMIHDRFVHVPIHLAVSKRHTVNPDGSLWRDVIEATGQPQLMING